MTHGLSYNASKAFSELFSGSARATHGFKCAGWCVVPLVDVADNPHFNFLNPAFVALVLAVLLEGLIALLWLGPPCSSFSMAVNHFWSHVMRSHQEPDGFTWLVGTELQKVEPGNALATIACRLFKIATLAGAVQSWNSHHLH